MIEHFKIKNIMANLRKLKKQIDYCLEEVVFDCDMAICFQPSKEEEIMNLMQEAVEMRNEFFKRDRLRLRRPRRLAFRCLCRFLRRGGLHRIRPLWHPLARRSRRCAVLGEDLFKGKLRIRIGGASRIF